MAAATAQYGLLIYESFYSFDCHVLCYKIALLWYLGMRLHEQKCPYINLCRDRLQLLSWQKGWTRTQTEWLLSYPTCGLHLMARELWGRWGSSRWKPRMLARLVTSISGHISSFESFNPEMQLQFKTCLHNQPGRKEKKMYCQDSHACRSGLQCIVEYRSALSNQNIWIKSQSEYFFIQQGHHRASQHILGYWHE